jgi:predicted component of type VI protein secretion system
MLRQVGQAQDPETLDWDEVAAAALRMASVTQDVELSCDEVYDLMDQFAEAAQRGEDVAALMPLVQRHLGMCPDCREEYEALQRMLAAAPAGS